MVKKKQSSLTADEAIKYIYDQSLLGVSETAEFNANKKLKGKERMHYLSIHDLIHQLINEEIPVEEKKSLIDTATEVMLDVFAGTSEVFIKKIMHEPIHLLHAQKLCENAKAIGYVSPDLLKLEVCIFECLMGALRDFDAAKSVLEEIEKALEAGFKLEPYYEALFKINKGYFVSIYAPNYTEAIQYMQDGLAILKSFEDKHNEEILRTLTNIAQYYLCIGDTKSAERFVDEGKTIFQKSESEAYNGLFLIVWSIFLNDKGHFEESLKALEQSDAYKALITNYPTMEHSLLYQKINTLIKLECAEEAGNLLKVFEKKIKKFYRGNNSMLATILTYGSFIYLVKQKNINKIFNKMNKAIKIYDEVYHGDKKHRNQARARLVMGRAYESKKDYARALQEYLLSEEIYNEILKEKAIDDVSDLYKELVFLGAKVKDEKLIHTYLRAHLKVFGDAHPRTQEILVHLDKQGIDLPL